MSVHVKKDEEGKFFIIFTVDNMLSDQLNQDKNEIVVRCYDLLVSNKWCIVSAMLHDITSNRSIS